MESGLHPDPLARLALRRSDQPDRVPASPCQDSSTLSTPSKCGRIYSMVMFGRYACWHVPNSRELLGLWDMTYGGLDIRCLE